MMEYHYHYQYQYTSPKPTLFICVSSTTTSTTGGNEEVEEQVGSGSNPQANKIDPNPDKEVEEDAHMKIASMMKNTPGMSINSINTSPIKIISLMSLIILSRHDYT